MSTEKPTPATATDKDFVAHCGCDFHLHCPLPHCYQYEPHKFGAECRMTRLRKEHAKETGSSPERPTTSLPSSCSSSHPEIRYRGVECPLCEALKELTPYRERRAAELNDAAIQILGKAHQRTCQRKPFPGWLNCTECFIAEHIRNLSRPFSAPGDGEAKS